MAPPVVLASLWAALSAVHAALEHAIRYFATTEEDRLLSDQLTLLPVLHDWSPASHEEATVLTGLLREYAGNRPAGPVDHLARDIGRVVREMAQVRARLAREPESS